MDASLIIPTLGRPRTLAACLRALAPQCAPPARFEVLVGFDGPDEGGVRAAQDAWLGAGGAADRLGLHEGPRAGQATVRNRLLAHARGRVLIFLNDDVIPRPGFVEAHLAAQREAIGAGRPAIVAGYSPWRVHEPDRFFDRLVRETSMVFFYDRMNTPEGLADRGRDWGFRHAWSLNVSMPAPAVREAGGFGVFPCTYGYEDDELAFRLQRRFGLPVLYRPEACAEHDHRMDPRDYLHREYKLGYAAWGFARSAPECALALFGRDITDPGELAYSRELVARERPAAQRLERAFLGLADLPASLGDGPHGRALVELAYGQHLLLKRWVWRMGLLAAAEDRPLEVSEASATRWAA